MIRARLLRENGKYLPRQSFAMRRHWFNNEEDGYFKVQKRAAASQVNFYTIVRTKQNNSKPILPEVSLSMHSKH